MTDYFLSELAEQDIDEIVSYIAIDNPKAAMKLVDELYQSMSMLAVNPKMGHKRYDLTNQVNKELRFWPVKWHYLVVYLAHSPIEIVRVLSGYRDISNLLS